MTKAIALLFIVALAPVLCAPVFVQGVAAPPSGCIEEFNHSFELAGDVCDDLFNDCTSCTQTSGGRDEICDNDGVTIAVAEEAWVDQHNQCPWSVNDTTDELDWDSNNNNACDNDQPVAMFHTAVSSGVDQWMCFTMTGRNGTPDSPGIVFRADVTDEQTSITWVAQASGGSTVGVGEDDGSSLDTCTSQTFDSSDELCAHITGTGAGAAVDVWVNPAAGTPDDFGAADCTLDAWTSTDSSGSYIGVRLLSGATNSSGALQFDDVRGGSCS